MSKKNRRSKAVGHLPMIYRGWDKGIEDKDKAVSKEWSVGTAHKKCECEFSKGLQGDYIFLPLTIQAVMRELCGNIQKEWQILLLGEVVDGVVRVDGYYIPKQTVTNTTVSNDDCIDLEFIKANRVIAGCHSHGCMKVFFSATDEITNMGLIKYHLVTNNAGDFTAIKQVELPCGLKSQCECEVVLEDNMPKVRIEGLDRINVREIGFVKEFGSVNNVEQGQEAWGYGYNYND